jgi:mediator of replication checkpoint protein 1
LEKARMENEELAKKEKSEAKKEAQANGEELPSSDEDDEEYKEAEDEAEELELSGSEDEYEGEDEEEVDEENAEAGLVDDQAADASEEDSEIAEEDVDVAESEDELVAVPRKARRALRIVDDEDEEDLPETYVPNGATSNNPFASMAAPNNPFAFTETSPQNPFAQAPATAPMGLTQAFAATMADSQDADPPAEEQDSLAQLDTLPDPDFLGMGQDSMPIATQQDTGLQLDLHLTQSQVQYDTLPVLEPTQSELPEPTQDMGFGMSSPVGGRFANAPPSTVDTVRASVSPVARRKGRLQRGVKHAFSDEEELADDEQDSDGEFGITADAFNVMKRAAQKAKARDENPFDKKKSEAKEMVEEQAQESEDEYAGIGGASDDESGGEMDEAVKQMIDEGKVDVDERQLAAFHA